MTRAATNRRIADAQGLARMRYGCGCPTCRRDEPCRYPASARRAAAVLSREALRRIAARMALDGPSLDRIAEAARMAGETIRQLADAMRVPRVLFGDLPAPPREPWLDLDPDAIVAELQSRIDWRLAPHPIRVTPSQWYALEARRVDHDAHGPASLLDVVRRSPLAGCQVEVERWNNPLTAPLTPWSPPSRGREFGGES